MITEDYVSFETAKLLKEKGFDEATYHDYASNGARWFEEVLVNHNSQGGVACPTIQMAMKWLREEKDVQIEIVIVGTDTWESPTKWAYGFRCQTKDVIDGKRNADFSSYEEAAEAAIRYSLENLI